jgi:hypothetical protein
VRAFLVCQLTGLGALYSNLCQDTPNVVAKLFVGGLTPEFVAQYFIDRRAAVHDRAPVGDNRISMVSSARL